MSPQDVAQELRSLSGVMGTAANDIDRNGDLLDIHRGDVDEWISVLQRIQAALDSADESR